MPDRFRVYGVPWHTGHNHALCQMQCIERYSFQYNPWRSWNHSNRPFPANADVVHHFDPSKHDVAILHVDHYINSDCRKMRLLTSLINALDKHDFPRVFINHTVPHGQPIPNVFGKWPVVCNSSQAEKEWNAVGITNTRTITHAYPSGMFYPAHHRPFSPSVLAYDSGSNEEMYDPGFTREVYTRLTARGVPIYRLGSGMPLRDFNEYVRVLQRHLVFLHTGKGCPMPRTRSEAIMCGAFCVTVSGHDFNNPAVADFADTPSDMVEAVVTRIKNALNTRMEGIMRSGKLQGILSWPEYQDKWQRLLTSVT